MDAFSHETYWRQSNHISALSKELSTGLDNLHRSEPFFNVIPGRVRAPLLAYLLAILDGLDSVQLMEVKVVVHRPLRGREALGEAPGNPVPL
jgi:hypothetical protein